ncbi:MAG: Ku protein [Burkholderiaceae bacterium]|jgi:DNA end-binding protein Ku
MAARSLSELTLSFGLVSIPVKLYSANAPAGNEISFHLLHKTCGSRLRQQYVCIKEEVVVPRDQMIKGYEFADQQYVTFTPEELKSVEEKGTHTVEIVAFLPITSIDPVFFDKPYYLAPDKRGARPYALLMAGMKKTGRCALARWVNRGKAYTVVVRASDDGGLVLQQLLYGDEVRPMTDIPLEDAEVKPQELDLAVQLINSISREDFDPNEFKDDVKARLGAAIDQKVAGQEITISQEPDQPGAQVIDLMAALRSSLTQKPAAASKRAASAPAAKPERKTARRAEAAAPAQPVKKERAKKSA